ncbi:hypothetical protein ACF0H5_013134 [Mactra antiquata]
MIDALFNVSECKEIKKRLKDVMASMKTLRQAKDIQLETLSETKSKALEDITNFQSSLEAMVKNAAETSRLAIENLFKKLEKEILQKKRDIDDTHDVLHDTKGRLAKADGNRAQLFSFSKVAERRIIDVEAETLKEDMICNTYVQLSFIPNQSLINYMMDLEGIGKVHGAIEKKHDLYRIKDKEDISFAIPGDSGQYEYPGCCITHDNKIIITDRKNSKLKRIDLRTRNLVDYCTVVGYMYDVCCVSKNEVAVTCGSDNKIQFVSISKNMTCTRQIKTSHACGGVATKDDKLYVSDGSPSLYVKIVHHITRNSLFSYRRKVAFNNRGNRLFVADEDHGVVCFDGKGNYLYTFSDEELKGAHAVCADGRGNIFVVGFVSRNVIQFNEDGKKIGVVLKQQKDIYRPCCVCFHQSLNTIFISMDDSNVLKMLKLE